MALFDAHTHLNFEKYSDEERRDLAAEIEASKVDYIVDVADCVASAELALADAAAYPWCYAAVGIHPDHASEYTGICGAEGPGTEAPAALASAAGGAKGPGAEVSDSLAAGTEGFREKAAAALASDLERIRELAADPKAVAIGEIGLDFYYGTEDREEQQELFRQQVRLAVELKMPIMIHSRDAHQLTMDILTEEGAFTEERKVCFPGRPAPGTLSAEAYGHEVKLPGEYVKDGVRLVPDARVQMHCFSGSPELALEYIKKGATISLGGPVTFKNGKKAAEVARQTPIECLLSETDAPYMAPEPLRGRPNKSPYIEHIVRRMAILKGIEYEEAAAILTANGRRFFGISE